MKIFDILRGSAGLALHAGEAADALVLLERELTEGLSLYWETADEILRGSGIKLASMPEGFLKLENNFFSALFLYSYHRAGIARQRRVLYVAVNHCLRGMVTGCDNILDDEYKPTIETDLPAGASRFRSVIDIMASDRILFSILMAARGGGELTDGQVLLASRASLHALTASGVQESSEELGVSSILKPEDILAKVHHSKTGLLFNCPWGVPSVLERIDPGVTGPLQRSLYLTGIGCQIMDDMVDLGRDVRQARHNYVASLIFHNGGPERWRELQEKAAPEQPEQGDPALLLDFPDALRASAAAARAHLREGLTGLFGQKHGFAVEPAMAFLYKRIGTTRFMEAADKTV